MYGTNSTTEAIYNDNGFDLVEVKKTYMTIIYLYNNNDNYRVSQNNVLIKQIECCGTKFYHGLGGA